MLLIIGAGVFLGWVIGYHGCKGCRDRYVYENQAARQVGEYKRGRWVGGM
jgi:hypothetical protein